MASPATKNAVAIGLLVAALAFLGMRVQGAMGRAPGEGVASAPREEGMDDMMAEGSESETTPRVAAESAASEEGAVAPSELEATLSANPFLRPFERLEGKNGRASEPVRVRPSSGDEDAPAPRAASFSLAAIKTGARPSAIVNGRVVFVGDRIENVRVHAIRSTGVELRSDDGSILHLGAR